MRGYPVSAVDCIPRRRLNAQDAAAAAFFSRIHGIYNGLVPADGTASAPVRTADFDYELPTELIAQAPVEPRDASRLLIVDRTNSEIQHSQFALIERFLRPGDLLVLNDSRVLAA